MERTEPSLRYDLRTGGTGVFGMDAWDRINDLIWKDFAVSPPQGVVIDRLKYGYDSVGNRTWRENVQDTTNSYDWFYSNDGIDRLDEGQRGQLNGTYTGLSTKKFAQDWTLDAVGNWKRFQQDFTGGGYTFDQTRTSNRDNEIDTISGSGGADWIDPMYSATGNMTKIPQPADPTKSFDAKYDAWNRLVELKDTTSTNVVAQYAYDGLFRRTVKKTYTSGSLSETRHFYYSDAWQVLEERIEVSSSQQLNRQYLWGVRYIDELVFRDRDTNNDGTLDERLYALQDANWNVTALWGKNSGGTAWEMKQRFEYNPYGKDEVLTAAFAGSTDAYAWETRYAGYRWDGESGLCQVRMRYYNPIVAVWIIRDYSVESSFPNLYTYCDTAPLEFVDPIGLEAHHWFPQDLRGPIGELCYCFLGFIDHFTTDLPNSHSNTAHFILHHQYGAGTATTGWNNIIENILKDSKDCCEFVTKVIDEITKAWKWLHSSDKHPVSLEVPRLPMHHYTNPSRTYWGDDALKHLRDIVCNCDKSPDKNAKKKRVPLPQQQEVQNPTFFPRVADFEPEPLPKQELNWWFRQENDLAFKGAVLGVSVVGGVVIYFGGRHLAPAAAGFGAKKAAQKVAEKVLVN